MAIKLFSAFTLIGDVRKLFTVEGLKKLFNYIGEQIKSYVAREDLLGPQKKAMVDEAVVAYLKDNFKTKNAYLQILVNIIIEYEPEITQAVYNWLKQFVPGLTKAE